MLSIGPPGRETAKPTWSSVKVSFYQPHQKNNKPHLDRKGGGPVAGWTGQTLKNYHCATGGTIKLGTIVWVGAPVNKRYICVDTGGAVRGKHLDLCVIKSSEYKRMRNLTGRYNVWKLGWLPKQKARKWKP